MTSAQQTLPLFFPVDSVTGKAPPGAIPAVQVDLEEAIAAAELEDPAPGSNEEAKP